MKMSAKLTKIWTHLILLFFKHHCKYIATGFVQLINELIKNSYYVVIILFTLLYSVIGYDLFVYLKKYLIFIRALVINISKFLNS